MKKIRNGFIMALAVIGTVGLLASCGGGGGAAATTTTTTTTTTATVGSSASSSGSTAVYSNNGATYAVTPTAAASVTAGSSQASLVTLPNTGTAVGALSVTSISATKITTTLKTAAAAAAPVNGTSVDPANDLGLAYSYTSTSISFFKLSTATEVAAYDTATVTTGSWSGGSALIPGVVMDTTRKYAVAATGDGFEIIDYATSTAPAKVREIKSVAIAGGANKGGVEINENFGYEPAITLGGTSRSLILTGGKYSSTNGNALELVDVATGNMYIPDTATKALFTVSSYIDHIAVDTVYHVAVLADEGTGTTFVDLSKLTLGTTLDANGYYSYTLPSTAVSRITTFSKYTNLAIESTKHLVFMGKGYGGTTFVVGKLADPATTLGFSSVTTTPVSMPSAADNTSATVSWYGSYDPHGAGAYLTPSGHPTYTTQTALALWASGSGTHIAIIDMQGVLDGQSVAGYNPTTTTPGDIVYFKMP
ncbi:MAG: hypothetical protein HZA03_07870 [Nitrospinae bacterium]|nr:hypothetical protein [Nitrospinota bacterium]